MNKKLLNIKNGNYMKFYQSKEWKKKRLEILERDNYECQKCKKDGRVGLGQEVHHIKELKARPDLALEDSNLVTLCIACHNEVHKRFGGSKPKINIPERW